MFWGIVFSLFTLVARIGKSDTECPVVSQNITFRSSSESTSSKITIMQYNVEWFFLDYYSAADCPGNGCSWKNSTQATTHMNYISKVIEEVNPDIINFCEVEGCDELNTLSSTIGSYGYYPYLKKGTDTATGQNVGMLTRINPTTDLIRTEEKISYPIPGSSCGYTGTQGTTGVSKHYITEFKFYGKNILFVGAHLIAFPTDSARCAQREAQAQILQHVVYDYFTKGYEILLLGDLNDFDAEIMDANNDKPTSHVLDILKGSFGTYSGKYKLKTVADKIPQNKRASEWWDKNGDCVSTPNEFSLIDHILLTPFLYDKITDAYIYQGYSEFCGTYNSDHYPVIIQLDNST